MLARDWDDRSYNMIRNAAKKYMKSSMIFAKLIAAVISCYLRFVYFTTRWQYFFPESYNRSGFNKLHNSVFITWHDRLCILPYSIMPLKNTMHILVSPHSDGATVANVLKSFGFHIIEGSTNKNSLLAVKNIIRTLRSGANVALTPDGPRGPRHRINSNIVEITKMSGSSMIPISCLATNYVQFKSWDKLIFPLPFGKISVYFGNPIVPDSNVTPKMLEEALNNLISGKSVL